MTLTVHIPEAIYSAVHRGAGRLRLQRDFRLSQAEARYYIRLITEHEDTSQKQTALILADLHIPYHHPQALEGALAYGESLSPDLVVILGDGMDFYSVSSWKKDPSRMPFAQEVKCCQKEIAAIARRFPDAKKVYIEGNHEARLVPYLWTQAKELYGLEALTVPELLRLDRCGWEYIVTMDRLEKKLIPYQLGDLYLLHGHEARCSINAVNIPRIYYNKIRRNLLVAHHHQTQSYLSRTIANTYDRAYSVGCLCELSPRFCPVNNWNHGFAVVTWTQHSCVVENKRIQDGVVL